VRVWPFPTADVDIDSFSIRVTKVGPNEWIAHLQVEGVEYLNGHPWFQELSSEMTKQDVWGVMSAVERDLVHWSTTPQGPF